MTAFSLESINNFLSTIIRERWVKKYGNDPVIDTIENPMDWTQFISQKLLMDNVSITRTENGYIIDEDDLQEILDDAEGDKVLMKQILQFKENLKFYDIHIDVNDLVTAVGYANIKKGADTIISHIDAEHQKQLKDFKGAPRINIQNSSEGQMGALSKSTQSVILDPNVRGSKVIRSDRRYFHINALPDLLRQLIWTYRKTAGYNINKVKEYCKLFKINIPDIKENDDDDIIYLISNDMYMSHNMYKIGHTTDIKQRLSGLQCAHPIKMKVIHQRTISKTINGEALLHKKYDNKRLMCEWFEIEDIQECIDYIESL